MPKEQALDSFYDRMISIPPIAITSLKKELTTTVGKERAKGIAIRYGWHNGVSDGEKVMNFQWESELELIKAGPKLHMLHGYLSDVIIDEIKYDQENDLDAIYVSWFDSFEVNDVIQNRTHDDQPSCHIMCGYASGYLSTVLKRPIIVQETQCSAMGHDHCKVICKPMDKYEKELENEYKYYQSKSMLQELDEITAKYKKERDNLNRTYEIHRKLIAELLSKKGLQRVVNILYEMTGLPAFIENEDHAVVAKSDAVTIDFELNDLDTDTARFIKITSDKRLLRTPIYFEQKVKGYCSFLIPKDKVPTDLDYMIIDQASLTASIIMLNENIKVNTEQNIKRGFLSDVLEGRLDKDELYKIARYLHFDPNDYYWMVTIERTNKKENVNDEVEVNEQLIRHLHSFFNARSVNVIVTQKSGNIVILIENKSFKHLSVKQSKFIKQLMKHISNRFKNYTFFVGVSSLVQHIDQLSILFEETLAALKTKNSKENILYFEDLGIESVLFQIPDDTLINRFVNKQIGELLETDKNLELVKTFYAYVENGLNINNTAAAISMSISGLRYRLARISDILDLDYHDTKSVFSVYMALNVLKAKGNITIK